MKVIDQGIYRLHFYNKKMKKMQAMGRFIASITKLVASRKNLNID
jgi:hypothetical protein